MADYLMAGQLSELEVWGFIVSCAFALATHATVPAATGSFAASWRQIRYHVERVPAPIQLTREGKLG